jgi:MFS transporter, DHA3 family, macrolide efflux protein
MLSAVAADHRLRLLICNQAADTMATRTFDTALVWIALQAGETYGSAALLVFLRFSPYLVLGLVGGWLSDQVDRRWVIILADGLRAATLAGAALLLFADVPSSVSLGTAAFVLTSARTVYQPAFQGLLPQVAPAGLVGPANSAVHATNELCGMLAPLLAGTLLALVSPLITILSAAAMFSLGALSLAALDAPPPIRTGRGTRWTSLWSDYRATFSSLRRHRPATGRAIAINVVAILGVGGLLNLAIPARMEGDAHLGAPTFGMFMATMASGTIPGAIAAAMVAEGSRHMAMGAAWLVYGTLLVLFPLSSNILVLLALGFALGFFGAIADVLFATIVQETMEPRNISKTFAIFSTLANTSEAISSPIAAGCIGLGSFGLAFYAGGGLVIVACAGYLVLEFLGRHRSPDEEE